MNKGLILAAPWSGSGKTTVTLGVLRALKRKGINVRGAKSGPDYIDPRFHEAACGAPCVNLDAWAMGVERLITLAAGEGLLLIEGAMGLFDGAPPHGKGATADLGRHLALPTVLIVDVSHMAQSAAPIVDGFARFNWGTPVTGVILNKVGSPRHEKMVRKALGAVGLPVLGALHRNPELVHPSRHLGLVQANERADLDAFIDRAADAVEAAIDLDALTGLAEPLPAPADPPRLDPPAQNIAIASDAAFAFAYPHLLADWRAAGATLSFFSPLADEAPAKADLIILPGGYPELHAGKIAASEKFISGIKNAAQNTEIYGECGGYMVLGKALTDADGKTHAMLGLLPLETSFAERKLHLGYRSLIATKGPFTGAFNGHEFHYATTLNAKGDALFDAKDAEGTDLPPAGLIHGNVSGSFAHIIDRVLPTG